MRRSLIIRTGIATVALTALGLTAAMPASAHTNSMYTFLYTEYATDVSSYATYSKTSGEVIPLPTTFAPADVSVYGIEVYGEKGTEVGRNSEGEFVREWNHTTGVQGDAVELTVATGDLDTVTGLDTLNNGTTVTVANIFLNDSGSDFPYSTWQIASVNSASGAVVPLVDISAAVIEGELIYGISSIATDPATGISYVFLQDEDSRVLFLPVDVATNTVGVPTYFGNEFYEAGFINGTDFDADGSLFMNYSNYTAPSDQLLRLGAPSTWATAAPTYISTSPAQIEDYQMAVMALTIEHTALAATGSELPIAAFVLLGMVAVLAGGVTVMVARRRKQAGTV